ncbi:MAG: phasin family protein [Actinomycetota bacterium]
MLDSVVSSVEDAPALVEAIIPLADPSNESIATFGIVAVDTTVLDSTELSVPIDTSMPVTDLLDDSTTSVIAAVTTTTVAPVPTPAPGSTVAATSIQSAFNIPGVGIITLKNDSASLKIVSVSPVSGWTFKAENKYATRVEIEFENRSQSVKFRAELINGRVIAAVSVDDEADSDGDVASATEAAAKEAYDTAERTAKATFETAEQTIKATFETAEQTIKATFEKAEADAKEANDEAALQTAKETYETALTRAKETYETALQTAKETYEAALRTAKKVYEAADD